MELLIDLGSFRLGMPDRFRGTARQHRNADGRVQADREIDFERGLLMIKCCVPADSAFPSLHA